MQNTPHSACQIRCSASGASCSRPIEPEPLHRPDGSIRSRRRLRYSNVFGLDRRKRDCRRAGRALTLGNGFPGRAVRRRLHFVCTRVGTGRRQWRRRRCSGTCCRRCACRPSATSAAAREATSRRVELDLRDYSWLRQLDLEPHARLLRRASRPRREVERAERLTRGCGSRSPSRWVARRAASAATPSARRSSRTSYARPSSVRTRETSAAETNEPTFPNELRTYDAMAAIHSSRFVPIGAITPPA